MTRPTVFLFPGQSSVDPGVIANARTLGPAATALLTHASDVLGRDVVPWLSVPPGSNHEVQLSVFLSSLVHLAVLRAGGIETPYSCGLSLGEYAHLVHIGALRFEDALRLVDARGRIYDDGPRGQMLAVFPLVEAELLPLIERARAAGPLFISNYNTPTQHVVGGDDAAITALAELVREETVADAVLIERRIPMHTPLFAWAGAALHLFLCGTPWQHTTRTYLPNVDAIPRPAPSASTLIDGLTRHVSSPVRWRQTMEYCHATLPDAHFVEVGPRRHLTQFLRPSWLPVERSSTSGPEGATDHLPALVERLRHDH